MSTQANISTLLDQAGQVGTDTARRIQAFWDTLAPWQQADFRRNLQAAETLADQGLLERWRRAEQTLTSRADLRHEARTAALGLWAAVLVEHGQSVMPPEAQRLLRSVWASGDKKTMRKLTKRAPREERTW